MLRYQSNGVNQMMNKYEWDESELTEHAADTRALAELLTPVEVLALNKALADLAHMARDLVPEGTHSVHGLYIGNYENEVDISGKVTVRTRSGSLSQLPYKGIAATALSKLNAATYRSVIREFHNPEKGSEVTPEQNADFAKCRDTRGVYKRDSISVGFISDAELRDV